MATIIMAKLTDINLIQLSNEIRNNKSLHFQHKKILKPVETSQDVDCLIIDPPPKWRPKIQIS